MSDKSPIEWTDATWNPIVGCSILSPGCTHCYAMAMAARIERMSKGDTHYVGTTQTVKGTPVWTGKLALAPQHILTQPLRWSRPRLIFVNSMGDLFHEDVPDAWIDQVFAVMALCPQHTFQVLTKRADRMRAYLGDPGLDLRLKAMAVAASGNEWDEVLVTLPMPNVWLGVSAERQQEADERIPHLLATPAAVRFVSAEPLIGPIDFTRLERPPTPDDQAMPGYAQVKRFLLDALTGWAGIATTNMEYWGGRPASPSLDWVIVGGESGKGARPMHPDWAREIRDQCAAAGVAFFFKQWGEWAPGEWTFDLDDCLQFEPDDTRVPVKGLDRPGADERMVWSEGKQSPEGPGFLRVGKAEAGRQLDGLEHNAMPAQPETEHLGTVAL